MPALTTTPSARGAQAEAAVASALISAGKAVYVPLFSAHSRVDLVFEDDDGLHRVQCKTGRVLGDIVAFTTCSSTAGVRRDYRGEVDYFGVYSAELNDVFLVPASDLAKRACHLRLAPTRNGQQAGIRFAVDYLLGRGVLPNLNVEAPLPDGVGLEGSATDE